MSIAGQKRKSDIDDVIRYELIDYPPWRDVSANLKPVNEMISEIAKFHKKWDSVKQTLEPENIKKAVLFMELEFYHHVNLEEEHGLDAFDDTANLIKTQYPTLKKTISKSEQEVLNLFHAFQKLKGFQQIQQNTKEDTPLLDEEILKSVHELLLQGINKQGNTKPGEYSQSIRITEYKGERHEYKPMSGLTLEQSVQTVLDRYNSLVESCIRNWEESRQESLTDLFKIAAYLLFQMLDVHPFADGNGRLCRLLVSYALSFATPFPSSVYNLWSDITTKDAYLDAIVETRKSATKQPRLLAAMIAECNWYAWKTFFERLHVDISEI